MKILTQDEYDRFDDIFHSDMYPKFTSVFTENDFLKEFEFTYENIRRCLSELWEEDFCGEADFAVGDDWGSFWQQCGGVYSERICCPQYINAIIKALEMSKYKDKWIYHTVYELPDIYEHYEFIIYKHTVYFPESSRAIVRQFQLH